MVTTDQENVAGAALGSPQVASPSADHCDAAWLGTRREPSSTFKELLMDEDDVPTYEQLESFGLFDSTVSSHLLAEYRKTHPLPVETIPVILTPPRDLSRPSPPRPSPQHRHSIAVVPAATLSPPSSNPPSPSLSSSSKLSPFALVRRATAKGRPSQTRTKSANDVFEFSVPPLLTPDEPSRPVGAPALPTVDWTQGGSQASTSKASLDRDRTIKEERAPRKLRRSGVPKPVLPDLRTDDDFLLRPTSELSTPSTSPLIPSPASSRPPNSRKSTWRSSLSSLVSSPTTFEAPHDFPVRPLRPHSPIDAFPSSVRRETLPPVDPQQPKKRGSASSSSDSYLGDAENAVPFPPSRRERTRSGSVLASPMSSVSSGGFWSKALKLGRRTSHSSSIASSDSTTGWEVVDGASETEQRGTFELIRKANHPARPVVGRSYSETQVVVDGTKTPTEEAVLASSSSSPNLAGIAEQPESVEERLGQVHDSPAASVESFRRLYEIATPPGTSAASSRTLLAAHFAPGGDDERTAATRHTLSRLSGSHLAHAVSASSNGDSDEDPDVAPSSSQRRLAPPAAARPQSTSSQSHSHSHSTSSLSLDPRMASCISSQSYSSRDSFFSGDETPAFSADCDDGDFVPSKIRAASSSSSLKQLAIEQHHRLHHPIGLSQL
ncbi:hypothetical protein JCM5296_003452 [Sporobolomyces johnsonii]